ncbi:MAG: sensor histidine kinase [Chitinophagaceae bacterium]
MKSHLSPALSAVTPLPSLSFSTPLHALVKKLQASLLPLANSKKSFIINDVPKNVVLPAEENTLAYIIGNLLSNAIYRTSSCCIRVETEFIAGQYLIRIKNNGAFAYSSYMNSLVHFVDVARKSGGNIGLETEENNGVTVVFSLSNRAA